MTFRRLANQLQAMTGDNNQVSDGDALDKCYARPPCRGMSRDNRIDASIHVMGAGSIPPELRFARGIAHWSSTLNICNMNDIQLPSDIK